MFGYIKPYKPEMKICEFDTFKAIYCGLCKELSSAFGAFSSLTLSYDFTFIATVSLGLAEECKGFTKCSCVANPFKKKACYKKCDELNFCAGCAMLMIYYKVVDNLHDSGFFGKIKALCALPFASYARKKAKKLYPEIDVIIKEAMQNQSLVEKSDTKSIDQTADPTAKALSKICEYLSNDEKQKVILSNFGYLIGRYVYLSDALDDLEQDIKKNEFNPFKKKFENENKSVAEIKEYAVGLINITIAEIAPAYELLNLKRYKTILDNIVYLGFHNTLKEISKSQEEKDNNKKKKKA
ncbi:MAG: DUF5685 family protein [Oscillospiraceae bacterium]